MRILGLSSATKVISFGLVDEEKVLFEKTVTGLNSEQLLFCAKEAGVEPRLIEGVAVTVGPGSYSGLRGGLATAKTLAQILNVPLVGVSTLEVIAYNLLDVEGTIAVMLDAKADDYNFALFSCSQRILKRINEDAVLPKAEIELSLKKITGKIYLAEGPNSQPTGVNVARLGLRQIRAGEIADPLTLVPQYSHQPNIREYML